MSETASKDIVERLDAIAVQWCDYSPGGVARDAKEEIERLRFEIKWHKRIQEKAQLVVNSQAAIEQLRRVLETRSDS